MNKRHILLAAVLIASPALAEDQRKPEKSQDQQAQGQTDRADSAQTAAGKSGSAVASSADARQVLSQSSNAALSKGQLQSLNQQFSQADQQRIGDLSEQGQQIDQSIEQLRQAYKEKYQKDLDLSANPEGIFTAEFFTVGQPLAARAQPAAARQDPDTGAAPAAPAADAQPAAASDAPKALIVIPKTESSPAAAVTLIKEGGQWKIDLPDDVDGKKLSTKLNEQVQAAIQHKDRWGANAEEAQRAIARDVLITFADPNASVAEGAGPAAGPGAGGARE